MGKSHGNGGGDFWRLLGEGRVSTEGGTTPSRHKKACSSGVIKEGDDVLLTLEAQPSMLAIDLNSELVPGRAELSSVASLWFIERTCSSN
ncbi:MAG TPA: hypothetical protein VGO47_11040 [Chlamydiales bacterium]|nr:hypothetical protein [Chlamydiales bacterium]